jgi:glutathione S-transferase
MKPKRRDELRTQIVRIALARDGKIELSTYPQVLAWIERVQQLPRYIPMAGI